MTPFPAPNRLHVWWARRALVAVRAAVLAYLLPGGCGQSTVVACHWNRWRSRGGPETDRRRDPQGGAAGSGCLRVHPCVQALPECRRPRMAVRDHRQCHRSRSNCRGGSVSLESACLGFETAANDLNPVATLIELATLDWPRRSRVELGPVSTGSGRRSARKSRTGSKESFRAMGLRIPDLTPTCGHGRWLALTVSAWCPCRPTGAWHLIASVSA